MNDYLEREWEDALPEEQTLQDPLYPRGIGVGEKRGAEKANPTLVINLHKNGMDPEGIARLSGLPLKFVWQVLGLNDV